MSTTSRDGNRVQRRRKLRWGRAKKELARSHVTDEKVKNVATLHALIEPPDLTLVSGAKGRPGRSVILT